MMNRAVGRKNMWATKNLNWEIYWATWSASSLKRLTASPGELGSERCAGRRIRYEKALRCSIAATLK